MSSCSCRRAVTGFISHPLLAGDYQQRSGSCRPERLENQRPRWSRRFFGAGSPSSQASCGRVSGRSFRLGDDQARVPNGSGHFYTGGDPNVAYWNPDQDEPALYSPSGIVDFVSWNIKDAGYQPGAAHNDAIAAGLWKAGTFIQWNRIRSDSTDRQRSAQTGQSLGRNSESLDSDSIVDFFPHGGVHARDCSPGGRNLDYADFIAAEAVPVPAASLQRSVRRSATREPGASPRRWTVLMYADGDIDLERDIYENLKEIERRNVGLSTDG
jgi:hypothetical protein